MCAHGLPAASVQGTPYLLNGSLVNYLLNNLPQCATAVYAAPHIVLLMPLGTPLCPLWQLPNRQCTQRHAMCAVFRPHQHRLRSWTGSDCASCMQAARAVAGTIRSFQPTIQELTQVSGELRTNLTKEMGLDELQREFEDIQRTTRDAVSVQPRPPAYDSGSDSPARRGGSGADSAASTSSSANGAAGLSAEEGASLSAVSERLAGQDEEQASKYASRRDRTRAEREARGGLQYGDLRFDDGTASSGGEFDEEEDLQRMRERSAAMAWGNSADDDNSRSREFEAEFDASAEDRDAALRQARDGGGTAKRLEEMTVTELEAELAKRRLLVRKIRAAEDDGDA